MKKLGVVVLILVVVVAVFLSFLLINFDDSPVDSGKSSGGELGSLKPSVQEGASAEKNDSENISQLTVGETGVVAGGGGVGTSEGIEGGVNEPESLPNDLYTAACGTYFTRYDVCAGSCPQGECINEGRSCYCKIK